MEHSTAISFNAYGDSLCFSALWQICQMSPISTHSNLIQAQWTRNDCSINVDYMAFVNRSFSRFLSSAIANDCIFNAEISLV